MALINDIINVGIAIVTIVIAFLLIRMWFNKQGTKLFSPKQKKTTVGDLIDANIKKALEADNMEHAQKVLDFKKSYEESENNGGNSSASL